MSEAPLGEVTKSYALASDEIALDEKKAARQMAIEKLKELIRSKGKNPDDYVFRDILPKTDLGLQNEEWKVTYTNAYEWEAKIVKKLGDDRFIAFYGIGFDTPTPKTLAVKFYNGSVPIAVYHLQKLRVKKTMEAYFNEPIGYAEGATIRIEMYAREAGDDYPVLYGIIAEPKGETIGRR